MGSPQRMKEVAEIIDDGEEKVVVLSAVSGTTNTLVQINELHRDGDEQGAMAMLNDLRSQYERFIQELYQQPLSHSLAQNVLDEHFSTINDFLGGPYAEISEKNILAQGELVSTKLFQFLLAEHHTESCWIPALQFMVLKPDGEPDLEKTKERLDQLLSVTKKSKIYITQGYICLDAEDQVTNLQRGGSDYTATILGAILNAEEIQIWTDIDGVHNNDPRVVKDTHPIKYLSYREAAELAYFGAKILHPTCVLPAEKMAVPIRLKNTMDPEAEGTLISTTSSKKPVVAVAAKDGITRINIHSHRMLLAYGFLRKIFEIFEKYETPIDMITTSEVAVSLTIDRDDHLHSIMSELESFGEVRSDKNQSIICLVGDHLESQSGYAGKIFGSITEIPVRMISYGGSDNNVSILIDGKHKKRALQLLNEYLFKVLEVEESP